MSDAPNIAGFSDLTLIGRGTSGTVYRARQEAMHRDVAVKVLQESTTDPNARERFGREVRTLGELSGHPAIVTTYTSGVTEDERPYLVMDLMASDISVHAPIDVAEAARMITAAAGGLAEAHRRGVLHRDIKPANIFLDRYGQIRLGDFGLVGLSQAQSITNASVGSPAYMAPELLASAKASVSSDLYALCVTLYWLIEGSLPFEAGDAGVAGLFHSIINQAHRPPERMGPRLTEFVGRTLSKDPAARLQSAADFIAELDVAIAADEARSAAPAPAPALEPARPPAPAYVSVSAPAPVVSNADRKRPRWLLPGALIVTAALTGGAVLVFSGGGDGAVTPDLATGVVSIRSTVFGIPDGEEDAVDSDFDSSGFLIDGGYIVTGHAAGVADDVKVTVDGEEVSAEIVGTADCSGISVLRLEADDREGHHLFDWSTGRIGFGNSVTVLGYDDDLESAEFATEVVTQPGPIVDGSSVQSTQFDLGVEVPEMSLGAPVLDRNNNVAGLVVAIDASEDASRTMSVDELEPLVDEIIRTGADVGLGISFREAGGSIGVRSVRPGSLGAEVGLVPGDEIVDIADVGLALAEEPLVDFCTAVGDIDGDEIPLRVRRDQSVFVGAINGDELVRESNTELEYHEITSDDGALVVTVPETWEVYDDPATSDYDGSVLSAQGDEGFIEYSVQPNRTPQAIIDVFTGVFEDTPECTPEEPVEYTDGVFTGLEMAITCTDQPDAINKLIAATEDSSGASISLLYTYDGSAGEEVVSQIESTFLLVGN